MAGLNDFASDLNAEENGIWTSVGDMKFLVARAGNKEWKKLYARLEKQSFGSFAGRKNKDKDDEKLAKIGLTCLAKTCILDWKNVSLDGKNIKYSNDKAVEILTDDRFRRLATELLQVATEEEYYMEEQIKIDEEEIKK